VLIVCAVSFQDSQPTVCDPDAGDPLIHQRYKQTDGQTDDMQSQDCALHYSTSRGNTETKYRYRTRRYYRYCRYCIFRSYRLTEHWMTTPTTTWNDNTKNVFPNEHSVLRNANTKYDAMFIRTRVLNNLRTAT